MKFAFFGYDYSLDIAETLIADGHELCGIFTFPCDDVFNFNTKTLALAQDIGCFTLTSRPEQKHIDDLIGKNCALFICCGYPYKIPKVPEEKACGINIHPSYLPRARGMMPLPHILLREPEAAGFTIHKISPEYDEGDILYQESIDLAADSDVETLSARIAVRLPSLMLDIVNNIEDFWKNARPQDHSKATLCPPPSFSDRTIQWDKGVEEILKLSRAYGRFGIICTIENNIGQQQNLAVMQLSGWAEEHNIKTGTLVRSSQREVIVAVSDGYICLKDFLISA